MRGRDNGIDKRFEIGNVVERGARTTPSAAADTPPPGGGDFRIPSLSEGGLGRVREPQNMQKIFNNKIMKLRRKELRNNMTHAEVLLWMQLKGSALGYKFRRQTSIGSFVVDFYCPSARLVLEIDGSVHGTAQAWVYDAHRQKLIERLGLRVLRFTNDEIFDRLDTVLKRIREHLLLPEEEAERWCE
jgi:very-short-patch-repair endonuclease